jgi:hypothetical protein
MQSSINPETPESALRSAADQLRSLAGELDRLAGGSLADPASNYLAWGAIKSTSKKLRNQNV